MISLSGGLCFCNSFPGTVRGRLKPPLLIKPTFATLRDDDLEVSEPPLGMTQVLFIETGFGSDQHGQNPTKACVKACKDAISFNSIPSIGQIIPGGRSNMKLRVQLAVPFRFDDSKGDWRQPDIDLDRVREVFPYGEVLPVEVQRGGMLASSGAAVKKLGDEGDDWIIAIAAVTIGF